MTTASSPSDKRVINLSINPTYFCNFRCSFCYLTPEQLGDKKRASVDGILERVDEVLKHASVGTVDLYGGEPFLLPPDYLRALRDGLYERGIDDLGVNTNLSVTNEVIWDNDWYISVSYDFNARERHDEVFQRMLSLTQEFSVLMLASPALIAQDVDEIIDTLNLLSNMVSMEVKPYSPNQANQLGVSYLDYEAFVKALYVRQDRMKFDFINAKQLDDVLAGNRNAFSDDHLYITPNAKFAVLEFDENDNEYFLELDSLAAYDEWCRKEKERVINTSCKSCRFFGRCLSEHLREVHSTEHSCNGFIKLIEWAETQ